MAVQQSGPKTSETSDGIIQNGLEYEAEDFFFSLWSRYLPDEPELPTDFSDRPSSTNTLGLKLLQNLVYFLCNSLFVTISLLKSFVRPYKTCTCFK